MAPRGNVLDYLSAIFILGSYRDYKNIVLSASRLSGPVDEQALREAVLRISDDFPRLNSMVTHTWKKGLFHLLWEPRPDGRPELKTSRMRLSDTSSDAFHELIDHLKPRLDRGFDLFNEVGCEFHLIELQPTDHIFVSLSHHSVVDGAEAGAIQLALFAEYHRLIRGKLPDWGANFAIMTSLRKKTVAERGTRLNEVRMWPVKLPWVKEHEFGIPVGRGTPENSDFHCTRRRFSEEETSRITERLRSSRVRLVDLAVAGAHLTVGQWNAQRNGEAGPVSTAITINMRRRSYDWLNPNSIVWLYFNSTAEQRKDPAAFLRELRRERVARYRSNAHLKFQKFLSMVCAGGSLFPLAGKIKLARFLMERLKWWSSAMQIHDLGIIAPQVVNGRPTGDSEVLRVGDLENTDAFGFGYKLQLPTPLHLWLFTYRRRLNITLGAWGWNFNRTDAEEFTDQLAERLLNFPPRSG